MSRRYFGWFIPGFKPHIDQMDAEIEFTPITDCDEDFQPQSERLSWFTLVKRMSVDFFASWQITDEGTMNIYEEFLRGMIGIVQAMRARDRERAIREWEWPERRELVDLETSNLSEDERALVSRWKSLVAEVESLTDERDG